jgi:hypothetical protein
MTIYPWAEGVVPSSILDTLARKKLGKWLASTRCSVATRIGCVSSDAIRAQLERILASPRFAHSERLKRFLRFSVEEALAGRAQSLKEYTLALEVFDKAASHDPGVDPIVRVEARRLRARLKEYYETEGRACQL